MARVAMIHPDTLFSPAELSEFLQIPEETLSKWRYRRTGPKFMRMGKHVRYRMSDVRTWMDSIRDAQG